MGRKLGSTGATGKGRRGPSQAGEVLADLPNGSSVCRAPNGTGTSKIVGKHPFPSSTKGRVDLSLPQPTVPRGSPESSLTYSPGSQGSCKGKPLPPGSPFLDFGTCKVLSHPEKSCSRRRKKLSRVFPARPPPTSCGGEGLLEDYLASLLEALRRLL